MRYNWYKDPEHLFDPITGNEVIFLSDSHLELHHCKSAIYEKAGDHKLFCSNDRQWFHLHPNGVLTDLEHTFSPTNRTPGRMCHNGKRGVIHPSMRHWGCQYCHVLVYEAWIGERHYPQKQIDHKNGNSLDYTPENLEEVTPSENNWRSLHVLQVLRAKGINPIDYTGTQMDHWFAIFRILEKYLPHHTLAHTRTDYLRWFNTPLDQFQAMWSKFRKDKPLN